MINKFLLSEENDLSIDDFSIALKKHDFTSFSPYHAKSTNSIWEGINSGKRYFIKAARKNMQNFSALSIEFSIFHSLNPEIEVLRFEDEDYLITAIEEFSPADQPSTHEVFELISSYELQLFQLPQILPKNFNFNLLIDFSREAISHFILSGQLGASWISRLENDIGVLSAYFDESDQVIVHGDVGPANILKSGKGLILIDWGDAFWGFQGFDQLYWLTFLKNSKDLNMGNIKKIDLDLAVCQSALNIMILLKEFLHRDKTGWAKRLSPKLRLESVQFS